MLSSMKCVAAPLAAVMLLASTAGSQPAAAFNLRGTSRRRRRPRRQSHLFTATAAAAVGAVAGIGAALAPASRSWAESSLAAHSLPRRLPSTVPRATTCAVAPATSRILIPAAAPMRTATARFSSAPICTEADICTGFESWAASCRSAIYRAPNIALPTRT